MYKSLQQHKTKKIHNDHNNNNKWMYKKVITNRIIKLKS
jgi:hypothetical protein